MDKLREHKICLELIQAVWKKIDWEKVTPNRRMKIYDELTSKIKDSSNTSSLNTFVANLCKKFEVRSLDSARVLQIVEDFDHRKLLKILRSDTQIIVLLLREKIEEKKALQGKNLVVPTKDILEGGLFDNEA